LDLVIPWGARVAIVGHSSAGKSTLLHLLGLLDVPDPPPGEERGKGREAARTAPPELIFSDGTRDFCYYTHRAAGGPPPLSANQLRRQWFGFVFQAGHLLGHLTAAENAALPLTLCGTGRKERGQRARALLRHVGLLKEARAFPRQLSGGEAQRVAVLRAIAHAPRVVFADEPTGNLDPDNAKKVLDTLDCWQRGGTPEKPRTLVLVTHDLDLAYRYCDCFVVLRKGRLVGGELKRKGEQVAGPADLKALVRGQAASRPPRSPAVLPSFSARHSAGALRWQDFLRFAWKDLFGPGNKLMTLVILLTLLALAAAATLGSGFFHAEKKRLDDLLANDDACAVNMDCSELAERGIDDRKAEALAGLRLEDGRLAFPAEAGGVHRWNIMRQQFWTGADESSLREPPGRVDGRTAQPDDPWLAGIPLRDGQVAAFSADFAEEILVSAAFLRDICKTCADASYVFLDYRGQPVRAKVVGVADDLKSLGGYLFVLPDGWYQLLREGRYEPQAKVGHAWFGPIGPPALEKSRDLLAGKHRDQLRDPSPFALAVEGNGLRLNVVGGQLEQRIVLKFIEDAIGELEAARLVEPGRLRIDLPAPRPPAKFPRKYLCGTAYLGDLLTIGEACQKARALGLTVDSRYEALVELFLQRLVPTGRALDCGLALGLALIVANLCVMLSQRILQHQAEIAILKANGMTPGTLVFLYSIQGAAMALAVSLLGVLGGWAAGRSLAAVIEGRDFRSTQHFLLDGGFVLGFPLSMVLAAAVGTALGAVLSVRRPAAMAVR
jgi:putative ABC transport system ATP-binding protein